MWAVFRRPIVPADHEDLRLAVGMFHATVAQLVEHRASNPEGAGSRPAGRSISEDEVELERLLGPLPRCPACRQKHLPSSPCYAGPSRVGLALYAEAAVRHQLELIWGDLSHAEVARMVRLSDEFIRQVRSGGRPPSGALLDAIGFERVVFYRRRA